MGKLEMRGSGASGILEMEKAQGTDRNPGTCSLVRSQQTRNVNVNLNPVSSNLDLLNQDSGHTRAHAIENGMAPA